MRILVVDDQKETTDLLRVGLHENGYSVDVAYTGEEAEDLAMCVPYDLIILDIMLPGKSGIKVCRSLRLRKIKTPVMLLTGKGRGEDQSSGLDCGADDYVRKPFSWDVLLARVRALLRRPPDIVGPRIELGTLVLDTNTREVWWEGKEIVLTAKEYAILECLARHPGRVVSRRELEQHAWDLAQDAGSNVLDEHIKNLRHKLGDRDIIETVRGAGYSLSS
jgi:DNA-binding response OmpR family regulator